MAILRVDNVGAAGFLPDVEFWKLPVNAWTFLQDTVVRENSLLPPYVNTRVFSQAGLDLEDVFTGIFVVQNLGASWYILCTSRKVYVTRGNDLYEITPAGGEFVGSVETRWQGTVYNGYLILNNGIDEPHYWPVTVDGENFVSPLRPLSEYPGSSPWPQGQTCQFILAYYNALFAGNIRRNDGRFPYLVLFSDFAEPGTLPQAWEPRPENSAGSRDLAEGQDEIIGAQVFKDALLVRKRNSVHSFRFSGGQFVYQRRVISNEVSCLNRHCIATTDYFQVSVGDNDIYMTEGQTHKSAVKNKTKEWFFQNLNRARISRCFVLHNGIDNEIWVFAPHGNDAEFCNVALIWNYVEDTFTTRTCENYLAGYDGFGINPDGFESWDDLVGSWDDWDGPWGEETGVEDKRRLFFVSLDKDGVTNQYTRNVLAGAETVFDWETDEALLERFHIPFPRGEVTDWETRKQISFITPKCRRPLEGFYIDFWLGFQDDIDSPMRWYGPKRWNPGKKKIAIDRSGRFVSIRARLPVDQAFRLTGYDIEYKLISKR